jgi:hypothetical protein
VTTVTPSGAASEVGNITFGTTSAAGEKHTFSYTTIAGQTKQANATVTLATLTAEVTGGTGMFVGAVGFHTWACAGDHTLSKGLCWSSTTIALEPK